MLIGYGMPAVDEVTLSGGSWLTVDAGEALFDGRPARASRISRGGTVTLTLTLASDVVPGIVALLGLNVPAGTAVTAAGASGVAHTLADGTVATYLLPAPGAPTSTVVITIAGAAMLEIGEIAIMPSVQVEHEPAWSMDVVDPTETALSRASQPGSTVRQPYRVLAAQLTAQGAANIRGGGLNGGMDWERLRMAITQDRRCIAIPRWSTNAELHGTAVYGTARMGRIDHLRGDWYGASLTAQEVPALA